MKNLLTCLVATFFVVSLQLFSFADPAQGDSAIKPLGVVNDGEMSDELIQGIAERIAAIAETLTDMGKAIKNMTDSERHDFCEEMRKENKDPLVQINCGH